MKVLVPGQLRMYTSGKSEVEASGTNLDEVFDDLNRQFPGFRFRVIDERDRVRRHMLVFVGEDREENLKAPIPAGKAIFIVGALSGG